MMKQDKPRMLSPEEREPQRTGKRGRPKNRIYTCPYCTGVVVPSNRIPHRVDNGSIVAYHLVWYFKCDDCDRRGRSRTEILEAEYNRMKGIITKPTPPTAKEDEPTD